MTGDKLELLEAEEDSIFKIQSSLVCFLFRVPNFFLQRRLVLLSPHDDSHNLVVGRPAALLLTDETYVNTRHTVRLPPILHLSFVRACG